MKSLVHLISWLYLYRESESTPSQFQQTFLGEIQAMQRRDRISGTVSIIPLNSTTCWEY